MPKPFFLRGERAWSVNSTFTQKCALHSKLGPSGSKDRPGAIWAVRFSPTVVDWHRKDGSVASARVERLHDKRNGDA
jgi:hypothetical protein